MSLKIVDSGGRNAKVIFCILDSRFALRKIYYLELMKVFGGKRMFNRFPRKVSALFAMLAVWLSAFSPMLVTTQVSAQTTTTEENKSDKKKDKKDKKQKNTETNTQTAQNNGKKPLSVNEDPNMIGKRNINKGLIAGMSGSLEKEVAMGRQIAAEVEKELKLVDDPMITEYVNRVGQNIVLHSDAKVPFTIKVVDSDEVNAFALPGGFFYVNKGLILAADNEAELAGVMAHEIAHVAARHAMENAAKNQLIQYGMLAGILFGGGIVGGILQNGGGILQGLAALKFNRGSEEEADRLGVQYLYAAGYDPNAMATMFEKLAAKNKKKPNSFQKLFTTHPQSIERRDATLALVSRFPEREEYVISTSEYQRVKSRLLRLSNARATISGDLDETDNSRPTLKRRQPTPDDPNSTDDSTTTKKEEPPQLKKRTTEQPEPTPTPTPQN
jgi:predicted Zn-dependent protease